jgi:phage tail-like protein
MPENFGLQNRFHVEVGGLDLGHWATCKGLEVEFVTDAEIKGAGGGVYDEPLLFPDRLKYKEIELTRAMSAASSVVVSAWLNAHAMEWMISPEFCVGLPAEIVLFDSSYEPVMAWTLSEAFPKAWKGPQFDASTAGVALETLVLTHTGFLL